MNIFTQYCSLLLFLAVVHEAIGSEDVYKLIRPYKYYQRRPSKWPRLYPGHKSPKFYRVGRTPPEDRYSRRPSYYRYRSPKYDPDGRVENQPCTIVIQLPRGGNRYIYNNYPGRERNHDRDFVPMYTAEDDYFDEEDEMESKVVDVNNKRVQIKMIKGRNPQVHIKISKSDNENGIRFRKMYSSYTIPVLQSRRH